MAAEISQELIQAAKDELSITWEDPITERQLVAHLRQGLEFLAAKTGLAETDLAPDGNQRGLSLLLNYVRYARSGQANEFETDYHREILGLRMLTEADDAEVAEN